MTPKTLSFLSPFLLPHHFRNPKCCNTGPGRVIIICKSVGSQNQQDFDFETQLSVSVPESQGTGAAAPTRGDIFLERQQLLAASSLVLEKKRKKKDKVSGSLKAAKSATYCCYGCGAPLQILEMDAPGYVDPETYDLV